MAQDQELLQQILNWVENKLGPFVLISDNTRGHPGARTLTARLRMASGGCYLKIHRDPTLWACEVHGYEHWALAFHDFAPRLLSVRAEEPLAIVVSEIPGLPLEQVTLSAAQQRGVWRKAGQALASLHHLEPGTFFGPCNRDGTSSAKPFDDAREYLVSELEKWLEVGAQHKAFSANEQSILSAARALLPAFEGELPLPCHRDYCPANWLVDAQGQWSGVIDFEFSYWDVRSADFTRYPGWEWIDRPDLIEAFFEGYGRELNSTEKQQILFGHALYAAIAVAWGTDNAYYGFAAEGHRALLKIGERLDQDRLCG